MLYIKWVSIMNDFLPGIELQEDKFYPVLSSLKKSNIRHESTFSSLDVFIKSKIFCIVSNTRRSKLTEIETIKNKKIKKDIPIIRKFKTSLGYTVFLSGPLLGMDDAAILEILVNIYHENSYSNGQVTCTYKNIAEKIGYSINPKKGLGGSKKEKIERSLLRLRYAAIEIRDENGELVWVDNILPRFKVIGKARGQKLELELNQNFIHQYEKNNFFTLDRLKLNSLDGDWEKALFRLICSVKKAHFKASIDSLYNLFHENEIKPAKIYSVKQDIKRSIETLILKGILEPKSFIDKNGNVQFHTSAAFLDLHPTIPH